LWFVDSDDYIADGAIKHLWNILEDNTLDILFFSCLVEESNGNKYEVHQQPVTKDVILSGETALGQGFYPSSSCNALWRREYIEELQLTFSTKVKYGEDSLFVFSAILPSTSIKFIEKQLYIYCIREGSTTTSKFNDEKLLSSKLSDFEVIMSIRDLSLKYMDQPRLSKLAQKQYQRILFGFVYSIFKNRKAWKKNGVSRTLLDKLKEVQLYPLKGPFYSWKKRLFSVLLNFQCLIS
jgi:hypothetical protein